jgi:hypothetical protein
MESHGSEVTTAGWGGWAWILVLVPQLMCDFGPMSISSNSSVRLRFPVKTVQNHKLLEHDMWTEKSAASFRSPVVHAQPQAHGPRAGSRC